MLQLKSIYPRSKLHWVVFSAAGSRGNEAAKGAEPVCRRLRKGINPQGAPRRFSAVQRASIKEFFEELKRRVTPDVIFTHWQGDAHQDHRLISEFTWNTFRNHLILEYEIPKYDGDLGRPNCLFPWTRLWRNKR